ncbi:MAG: hypothetical protein P4L36_13160 [Holophaga sp.]|nr:hypothetical protein [Holophaga sp.]
MVGWLASLCRWRGTHPKQYPVLIENPWAEGISPAHLELIRERSLEVAREVLRTIDSGPYPRKQKKQAHQGWETYKEIAFIAGCRLWVMDRQKEYSHSLWAPHLKAVQDLVVDRIQHQAPAREENA